MILYILVRLELCLFLIIYYKLQNVFLLGGTHAFFHHFDIFYGIILAVSFLGRGSASSNLYFCIPYHILTTLIFGFINRCLLFFGRLLVVPIFKVCDLNSF